MRLGKKAKKEYCWYIDTYIYVEMYYCGILRRIFLLGKHNIKLFHLDVP